MTYYTICTVMTRNYIFPPILIVVLILMRQSCVLSAVLKEIDLWMCKNLLKLNQDKTELVVISSKCRNGPNLEYVPVGDEFIAP